MLLEPPVRRQELPLHAARLLEEPLGLVNGFRVRFALPLQI